MRRASGYLWHAVLFLAGLGLGIAAYARLGPDAASLDPGVQAALLLIVSVTLAAVAGGAGAVLASHNAAQAAREATAASRADAATDREAARVAREQERLDAERDRFAEQKVVLAVALLQAADAHQRQAEAQLQAKWDRWEWELDNHPADDAFPIPKVDSTEPVRQASLALELVAPWVTDAADGLYTATVPLGRLAASWREPHGGDTPVDDEYRDHWDRQWATAVENWAEARATFVLAVRRDLGVVRLATEPRLQEAHHGAR